MPDLPEPNPSAPALTTGLNVTSWSPGEDVIEVHAHPCAGCRARHLAHVPRDRARP